MDIDNILVSNKISSGEKNYEYLIGCLCDNYKIKPLHVMFPEMSMYLKKFDGQTKSMYFLIEDDDLLGKYNKYYLR